jgi:putrescine aminotransferase
VPDARDTSDSGPQIRRDSVHVATTHNLTKHWQALDAAHHIPSVQRYRSAQQGRCACHHQGRRRLPLGFRGKQILDGMAGLWCVQLGYGNRELAEAGYEALRTLPTTITSSRPRTPTRSISPRKLATLLPEGHARVLFANSGSEANDSALKLIRYYWNLKGRPEKKIHLSRDMAYHGVTMAAASLSGLTPMHPQWDLPLSGFEKVPAPYWWGAKAAGHGDIEPEAFGAAIAAKLEDKIVALGADNVASFSAEPVQGAGRAHLPARVLLAGRPAHLREITTCCFTLTRSSPASVAPANGSGPQTYGIAPDIMTMAKGLSSGYQPISAISLGARMGEADRQCQ